METQEFQLVESKAKKGNAKRRLIETIEKLEADKAALEGIVGELKKSPSPEIVEELRKENQSLVAQVSELNYLKLTVMPQLEAIKGHQEERIAELEAEVAKLKEEQENIPTIPSANARPVTIEEEKDELDLPCTPPTKSFARPSIGQWSVDRMKNNMSVRRLVNKMEKK